MPPDAAIPGAEAFRFWLKLGFISFGGPRGFDGPFDIASALMTAVCALALFRFRVGVMPLLAASASTRLLLTWSGLAGAV